MSTESYEQKLAAWKASHGLDATKKEDLTAKDIMAAEDAKSKGTSYCWKCAEEFPIKEMVVDDNPYIQYDECPHRDDGYIPKRYRIRMCKACEKQDADECG